MSIRWSLFVCADFFCLQPDHDDDGVSKQTLFVFELESLLREKKLAAEYIDNDQFEI